MRVLITGLNGTLAPRVAEAAAAAGWAVFGWDRAAVPPDDVDTAQAWLQAQRPDAIAHLALGSEAWADLLARHAAATAVPLVFTSTAMVFDATPDGPHRPGDARTARDDYGRSKIRAEDVVRAGHPQASVLRIGWQIDPERPGNNMLAQLDGWQARDGEVAASTAWRPACSFMADTAQTIVDLLARPRPGLLHLDSNAEEGHSFAAIVQALRRRFARHHWQVRAHAGHVHDQRLVDGLAVAPLSARLPLTVSG